MVQRVREMAIQIRTAEREIVSCQRRIGIGGEAGAELLRKLCRERKDFQAVKRKTGVSEDTLLDDQENVSGREEPHPTIGD